MNNIDAVYKLDLSSCPFGKCKKDCTANPFCLNGLGEKKIVNVNTKRINCEY